MDNLCALIKALFLNKLYFNFSSIIHQLVGPRVGFSPGVRGVPGSNPGRALGLDWHDNFLNRGITVFFIQPVQPTHTLIISFLIIWSILFRYGIFLFSFLLCIWSGCEIKNILFQLLIYHFINLFFLFVEAMEVAYSIYVI